MLPGPGYALASLSAPGAVISDRGDGSRLVVYSNLQANQTVTASFSLIPVLSVSAGNDLSLIGAGAEFAGTLFGSASGNQGEISYAWSGAGLSFGTPSAAVTTVYAAQPGNYSATLTASSGSLMRQDSVTVTVREHIDYQEEICTSCHAGSTPQVVADYDRSLHKLEHKVSCQDCHSESPHTGELPSCADCHATGNSLGIPWPPAGLTFHSRYDAGQCKRCHASHNPDEILEGGVPYPHYSSYSTAQYVTAALSCDNCHTSAVDSSFNIYSANSQWARSAKGNPNSLSYTAYDFKALGNPATPATTVQDDCVRCHTTTGYVNYVSSDFQNISAWGVSGELPGGDRSREMVACSACHTPTPFSAEFARRVVGIQDEETLFHEVRAWYNYSSSATKKIVKSKLFRDSISDLSDSNICIACHSGRGAGDLIKHTVTNPVTQVVTCSSLPSIVCRLGNGTPAAGLIHSFWGNVDFIDPHGGSAASLIYPDNLRPYYEYRPATDNTSHINVGLYSGGPCVGCHMSQQRKHSFTPLSTATSGAIAGIVSPACAGCHRIGGGVSPLSAADLEGKRTAYRAGVALIKAQLADKGIHYNAGKAPYFFTTPDPALQSQGTRVLNWNRSATFQGAHLLGAAFNLRLLDSGSGWIHNATYARRVLYDTIDYLDDGDLTSHSVAATVQDPILLNYIYPRR